MRGRLPKWNKGIVEWREDETVFLSVVFSWDADEAYARALFYRAQGLTVRIGGPGVFVKRRELESVAQVGGSIPDVVHRHNPAATFASRGCPVGCWFCIVPKMEGVEFTLIDDFQPRPILCDNNLSALPADFQEHVIRRYEHTGVPLLDANSGFEPATFDAEVYARWRRINRGPWRFAFDESGERAAVARVMAMLKDVSPKRKRVYVLIGNEPVGACLERIREVLAWGGEPHVQPIMKLTARRKEPWVRFDWTTSLLADVARWANRRIWRYVDFDEYQPHVRTASRDIRTLELFDQT